MTFTFRKSFYQYFDHPYNRTRSNERAVEIPIALDFINKFSADLIEVGCVTPYYILATHEVIDLADKHPSCKNEDATLVNFKNRNVLSISTLEHIGRSDYGIAEKEKNAAIELTKRIIKESNNFFITWPLGYNLTLDEWAFNNEKGFFLSRDDNQKTNWIEKQYINLSDNDKKYGTFHCANTIIILTNI
jgi:hypothetical protein